MEGLESGKRLAGILEKYKYALAVALVGIILMLLPGKQEKTAAQSFVPETVQEDLEDSLESVLSQIEGAGSVKVLLSPQTGEEILYQTDTDEETDTAGTSRHSQTVLVSDEARNETGLIRRTDPPKFMGAVIVCQGADRAQVRLAIVQAVSCVTGLSTNQISVLKMK